MKAILALLIISTLALSSCWQEPVKPSIEDKLSQLKEMRAEKKSHQNAIFTIDQKIVPLKCGIYSEVQAKEQWDLECQDFFQEQQSKIRAGSTEEVQAVNPMDM